MIILWITRRKDKAGKTAGAAAAPEKAGDVPEATPDVKGMLTGQGDTLAPVHVARLSRYAHN